MKLSKMVEETLTAEDLVVIEEKKKCKKTKILVEEGMVNCADCGTEYNSNEADKCPACQCEKTMKADAPIDEAAKSKFDEYTYTLPSSWASAIVNSDSSGLEDEDEEAIDALYKELDKKYKKYTLTLADMDAEPEFKSRSDAPGDMGKLGGDMLDFTVLVPIEESVSKEDDKAELEKTIKNLKKLLADGDEAQANDEMPPQGYGGAQEMLRKAEASLKSLSESEEAPIAEGDVLVETPATAEETAELEYLKSLSGI